MAWFQWISVRPVPARWDLRRCGWQLAVGESGGGIPIARLIDAGGAEAVPERLALALRPHALALGLADSPARARWLAMGYGDALPADLGTEELDQRAARTIASPPGPMRRCLDRLTLDLLTRDALVDGRRLHLHPREFALLWRLAEVPGAAVSGTALLHDVFDLRFDPGTNRLAVHVCRLRKKLALAGFADLLATLPGAGGYRLIVKLAGMGPWDERGDPPQRMPLDRQLAPELQLPLDPQFALDHIPRLSEHALVSEELVR